METNHSRKRTDRGYVERYGKEEEVIVYRCDICGEVADCSQKQIEGRDYDFCARCWGELESKLQGKGRPLAKREMVLLTPRAVEHEEAPEKPAPRRPPTILANVP